MANDGGDEDPAELLRTALSQDTEYESGVINIGLDGSLEGITSGSIDAASRPVPVRRRGGAARARRSTATADVRAEGIPKLPGGSFSFDFSGGLALADDSLFVTYNDTTYQASQRLYSQISPLLETAEQRRRDDPGSGERRRVRQLADNLENEGTEDIEGESVSTSRVTSTSRRSPSRAPRAGRFRSTPAQLEGLTSTVDVYVAEEDDTFRRLDLGFTADGVEALSASGIDGFDFTLSVGISGPNEEQTIEAPADAQPLDELLQQFGTSEADLSRQLQQGLQGLAVPGAARRHGRSPALERRRGPPTGGQRLPRAGRRAPTRTIEACLRSSGANP